MEEQSIPDFGAVVRFHRRRASLSRVGLARLAGVGKTTIFDIEHGKKTIRLATLLRVLKTLNVRLDWHSPLREAFEAEQRHA